MGFIHKGASKTFLRFWAAIVFIAAILFLSLYHPTPTLAFSINPVLDNFNRTENPLSNGSKWSPHVYDSGANVLKTNATQVLGNTTGAQSAYWNPRTFGPNSEAHITSASLPDNSIDYARLFIRLQTPGSAAADGYALKINSNTGTDTVVIQRLDNGAFTDLITFNQEILGNDKLAISAEGSTLTAWYWTSGPGWTSLGSTTDSTYTSAGSVGMEIFSNAILMDDFSGGNNFPLTSVLDNFNRANGGLGSNWTSGVYESSANETILAISTNAVSNDGGGATVRGGSYWNASTFGPDSEAFMTVPILPNTTNNIGLYLRVNTPGAAATGYALYYNTAAGGTWVINRIDAGFSNNTDLITTTGVASLVAGDKIGFSASGSLLTAYRYDGTIWTAITSTTDATYSSAGYIGMYIEFSAVTLDDFGGGTMASNVAPVAPTLALPTTSATQVPTTPLFQLSTTDANGDYLKYKIILYDSDCASNPRTFDQTSSQVGWLAQDQQTGSAYTGGSTLAASTMANYILNTPLKGSTTYCWKAAAIDPAGTNTFGAFSATQTFTTAATAVYIKSGTTIKSGVTIH